MVRLTLRVRTVPVQNSVPGEEDFLLLQDPVHFPSVLNLILHFNVVDDIGRPELGVADGLVQGKALGVEGNQAVAKWPFLYRKLSTKRISYC